MFIDPKTKALNESVLGSLTSQDTGLQKEASNGVSDYLRMRAREDGFARKILPPVQITPADLDRQASTVKPVIVKDMEPDVPAAYSIPFGGTPINRYMGAPRYRVTLERIVSRRFTADVANLLTYDMDIKQVFNDLMLKTILAEEDSKFIAAADTVCEALTTIDSGSLNPNASTHVAEVGSIGYKNVGALSRTSLSYALKGLAFSNRHLNPAMALVNNRTIWQIAELDRSAIGGDMAQDIFLNGVAETQVMGVKFMVTIKTDLVADNILYSFAAPKYLGDFFMLDDVTVSTKSENYMFEMFAYECIGAIIKNSGAICKAGFTGTFGTGWIAP